MTIYVLLKITFRERLFPITVNTSCGLTETLPVTSINHTVFGMWYSFYCIFMLTVQLSSFRNGTFIFYISVRKNNIPAYHIKKQKNLQFKFKMLLNLLFVSKNANKTWPGSTTSSISPFFYSFKRSWSSSGMEAISHSRFFYTP